MKEKALQPVDARGNPISLGSRVRIISAPDFSDLSPASIRAERERVFQHIIGQCKVVDDIDTTGYVGMSFKIRKGQDAGIHCIWLDSHHVLVQLPRTPPNKSSKPTR